MKNNSMKTAPKGRTPPMNTEKTGCMYHACSGIWRGILFVRTGSSTAGFLKPKYDPMNTRGTDIPNHRKKRANSVPKGTAPDDFWPQMSRFSPKNITKTAEGKRNATLRVLDFQSVPWNILNMRADACPAKIPISANKSNIAVMRPPRLAGERNPKTANTRVTTVIPMSCTPVPVYTVSAPNAAGGRKTSPWTSFQPVSS
mmetsp:Transcript_5985/g.11435  ORF Transcript_5985/g.11435 Transcript_5985/m.11435 type:complete len:200 (+) Transcript_5985:576-1175(+)